MATGDPTPQIKRGPSGLLKLPPELVEKIASHLSPTSNGVVCPWKGASEKYTVDFVTRDNFLSLRHTCRQMNDMTFSFFRRQYFTERVVKLQTKSLQELSQIAAHPTLARQVQKLKIAPHFHDWWAHSCFHIQHSRLMKKLKDENTEEEEERDMKPRALRELKSSIDKNTLDDQKFWSSGLAAALLARIFASLKELHAISYGDHHVSNPKLRLFDRQTARLWEAAQIQEIEGTSIEDFHEEMKFHKWLIHRHQGFEMVKAALIASGKSFSSLRFEHGSFLLRHEIRHSKPEIPISLLEQCLEGLKALHVSFSPILPEYVSDTNVDEDLEDIVFSRPSEESGPGEALLFLAAAPRSIEELGLYLNVDPYEEESTASDKVFAATPACDEIFTTIKFPGLRKLSIKNTFHTVKSMAQLLSNHKMSLSIVQISPSVPQPRDPEYFSYVSECPPGPNFDFDNAKWSVVLEALLQCENLVDLQLRTQSDIYTDGGNILASRKPHKWRGRLWYAWEDSYNAAPWVIEPRAKFFRKRLEQHLEDWKEAERVHKV
ncbi:hypothetical protein IWX90DRAFT_495349 [Phyllosticta citrichinensis]|uniref:F-box domain-containing protein n=1 Tax=Phyllosticta citrichinensis TaxID=1130410 RepID=A0ABR1XGL3_9PEZI